MAGSTRRGVFLWLCVAVTSVAFTAGARARGAEVICGDGVVDAGEDCDVGGTCIGGPAAGKPCRVGDATCTGGACTTFGGMGCAANCTTETDVAFELEPGVVGPDGGPILLSGTSGVVECGDFLTVPLPLNGRLTLTVGRDRGDGQVPVVLRPLRLAAAPVANIACGCVRVVAARTCGGTLRQPDGAPAVDCTGDASTCAGRPPCAAVHGEGNAGHGTISCGVAPSFNCDELTCCEDACAGISNAGEALLYLSSAVSVLSGQCTGTDPSTYGPDGAFCTDDDPSGFLAAGVGTLAATTGTARVGICAGNCGETATAAAIIVPPEPPCSARGRAFTCAGGRIGAGSACLAYAAAIDGIGNQAFAGQLCGRTAPAPTPTPSPTPVGTPAACLGDCDGDGRVTVNELITMVNIVLGSALPDACPAGPAGACGRSLDVTCLLQAISHALEGCG
jgi:hypothetical protein